MIVALCNEKDSFRELMNGCEDAQRAMKDRNSHIFYDYYDGRLFTLRHGKRMMEWNPEEEFFVFLTMSTDGFEVFRAHDGSRSAWPVAFIVLNFSSQHRFRASNAIVAAFITGNHDPESFDMFLKPIIDDLVRLEEGVPVLCADGKRRLLRAFVILFTSDWPAGTKVLGHGGHNCLKPCRVCHKNGSWVAEANGVYLVPDGSEELLQAFISGSLDIEDDTWMEIECKQLRNDQETRKIWDEQEEIVRTGGRGVHKRVKILMRQTGIKRKPVISRLSFDSVHSAPYDPMHCILLGWIKLVISLCIGSHPKTKELGSAFVVGPERVDIINGCLASAHYGIPSSWGRPPLALSNLSSYKAEDFKNFGLYYGQILFQSADISQCMTDVWVGTSRILHGVLDPTPLRSDVYLLRKLTAFIHAKFTALFCVDDSHKFCFTPNTHAFLYLSDILEQCGPLTNISQFTIERLIGEVGCTVTSRLRPETNLFRKTQKMFYIRLLLCGLATPDSVTEGVTKNDEYNDVHYDTEELTDNGCLEDQENDLVARNTLCGIPKTVRGKRRMEMAFLYVKALLLITALYVQVTSISLHSKAKISKEGLHFDIETFQEFSKRSKKSSLNARQKCWIAGHFEVEVTSPISSGSTHTCSTVNNDVYYGCIEEIWEINAKYRRPTEQIDLHKKFRAARISWQNGLHLDSNTGIPYARVGGNRRGSVRDTSVTVEDINCVARLVGFITYRDLQYFIDPEWNHISTQEHINLRGFCS